MNHIRQDETEETSNDLEGLHTWGTAFALVVIAILIEHIEPA